MRSEVTLRSAATRTSPSKTRSLTGSPSNSSGCHRVEERMYECRRMHESARLRGLSLRIDPAAALPQMLRRKHRSCRGSSANRRSTTSGGRLQRHCARRPARARAQPARVEACSRNSNAGAARTRARSRDRRAMRADRRARRRRIRSAPAQLTADADASGDATRLLRARARGGDVLPLALRRRLIRRVRNAREGRAVNADPRTFRRDVGARRDSRSRAAKWSRRPIGSSG